MKLNCNHKNIRNIPDEKGDWYCKDCDKWITSDTLQGNCDRLSEKH